MCVTYLCIRRTVQILIYSCECMASVQRVEDGTCWEASFISTQLSLLFTMV